MRIASIDFFRFLAVLAVILIHTKPFMRDLFPAPSYRLSEYLFNQPPRFAVPFFFVTSGYFLAQRFERSAQPFLAGLRYLQRPAILFVAWSLLYLLLPSNWPETLSIGYLEQTTNKLRQALNSPLLLVLEGTKIHLWFLSSLISGGLLLTLLASTVPTWLLLAFSGLLYGVGLLDASYAVTPLGIHLVPFYTRNGPFLSTICLAVGFWIYQRRSQLYLSPQQSAAIALSGMTLHVSEAWGLWLLYDKPMQNHDFLIGTVVCAAGLLLLALSSPDLGKSSKLHRLGQYTLGVYLCHYLYVDILGPLTYLFELHIWQFLMPLLVFLLSLATTAILLRWRWTKWLVS